jgi:DNA topoisomerase-3
MELHEGKAGVYFQCRPCNVVEKAEEKKKAVNKRDERKLVQQYTQKDDFGTSLGDLLKQALKKE